VPNLGGQYDRSTSIAKRPTKQSFTSTIAIIVSSIKEIDSKFKSTVQQANPIRIAAMNQRPAQFGATEPDLRHLKPGLANWSPLHERMAVRLNLATASMQISKITRDHHALV
jgi:hypothetical protein